MLTVTSTRPRDSREVIRFLIEASRADSSAPTRRCMSRNRLLTVFRSTETEKSSPATMPLAYPIIEFILVDVYSQITQIRLESSVEPVDTLLPHPRLEARKAFDTVHFAPTA